MFRVRASLLPLLLLITFTASASDLKDYSERLNRAALIAQELGSPESVTEQERSDEVAELRDLVPKTETVEWEGGEVETDHTWLHRELDDFQKVSSVKEQTLIMNRVEERLTAIVRALEGQLAGDNARTATDEEKRKLAEILGREEFQKPVDKEESLFQRWWREFLEWLARNFPRTGINPNTSMGLGGLSLILQLLLYVLLAAGIGYLIYRLVIRLPRVHKGRKGDDAGDRVILGELVDEDVSSSDLFDEAEQYARRGEIRMAIRKGYMALLCELADRRLIGLARNKTNRDYLRDIKKRRSIFEDFKQLTLSFETHWYGLYPSDETAWQAFRDHCRELLKKNIGE